MNVGSGWHDWYASGNQYGLGEPHRPGTGAPVNLDDPMDGKPLIDADRRRGLRIALESLE